MNILALDTSDNVLSAALSSENGVFYAEIDAGARHSELLPECIDNLFSSADMTQKDLNLVACMQGPGSFTGLRIGFSTAKGLSMALGIPITAVPTLDCIAFHLSFWPGIVIPAIDAKKKCFFTAIYRGKDRLTGYMDAEPETIIKEAKKLMLSDMEPMILTGSGAGLLYPHLASSFTDTEIKIDPLAKNGRAKELLEISKNARLKNGNFFDSGPVYIRKSDAELSRILYPEKGNHER